jgi:hypothetical protein
MWMGGWEEDVDGRMGGGCGWEDERRMWMGGWEDVDGRMGGGCGWEDGRSVKKALQKKKGMQEHS